MNTIFFEIWNFKENLYQGLITPLMAISCTFEALMKCWLNFFHQDLCNFQIFQASLKVFASSHTFMHVSTLYIYRRICSPLFYACRPLNEFSAQNLSACKRCHIYASCYVAEELIKESVMYVCNCLIHT